MSNEKPAMTAPLPWRVKAPEMDDDQQINGAGLVDADGHSVFTADCGDYNGLTLDEAERIVRAVNSHAALLAALKAMVDRYTSLADSGDCGHWDSSKEPEVIAARAAIAHAEDPR